MDVINNLPPQEQAPQNPVNTPGQEQAPAQQSFTLDDVRKMMEEQAKAFERRLEAVTRSTFAEQRVEEKRTRKLSQEVSETDQLRRELKQEKINANLVAAFERAGVREPARVAKFFGAESEGKLDIGPDGQVVYNEGAAGLTPLNEYVGAWLKTSGSMFVPAPQGASIQGTRGSINTGVNPYRNMDFSQIQERRRVDPEGYRSYLEAFPEEYKQKQFQWMRGRR